MKHIHFELIDGAILGLYFVFILGLGWWLRRRMKTSNDYFISGRSIPPWITSMSFIAASGAMEIIGMGASGAKYGIMTCHFYWVGAIPAMVFLGVLLMPFYYGSRARSLPEYLKLRYDEKTRVLNAVSFLILTLFTSGISMYVLAELFGVILGWNFNYSLLISAVIILSYVFLGGLTAAIYNDVLQFVLGIITFAPLLWLGLRDVGWWQGLKERLAEVAIQNGFPAGAWSESWSFTTTYTANPMGVNWLGIVMGLGFVLSFGYWCADFTVVQRAMASNSMAGAQRTPIVGAVLKMMSPFLIVFPGMIAIALTYQHLGQGSLIPLKPNGEFNYDLAIPMMLNHYLPVGMMGIGITTIAASFISGVAGNLAAFNTVLTCDIYQNHICPGRTDIHYLWAGRFAAVLGIGLSVIAAYLASSFNNIMDLLQLVYGFVNAPVLATFILGAFWRRTTGSAAFYGLLLGMLAAILHDGLTQPLGATTMVKGGWLGTVLHQYPSEMAQNFSMAILAWSTCFISTIMLSLVTKQNKADDELRGLVYSLTPRTMAGPMAWYKRPVTLGLIVLAMVFAVNFIFW